MGVKLLVELSAFKTSDPSSQQAGAEGGLPSRLTGINRKSHLPWLRSYVKSPALILSKSANSS